MRYLWIAIILINALNVQTQETMDSCEIKFLKHIFKNLKSPILLNDVLYFEVYDDDGTIRIITEEGLYEHKEQIRHILSSFDYDCFDNDFRWKGLVLYTYEGKQEYKSINPDLHKAKMNYLKRKYEKDEDVKTIKTVRFKRSCIKRTSVAELKGL